MRQQPSSGRRRLVSRFGRAAFILTTTVVIPMAFAQRVVAPARNQVDPLMFEFKAVPPPNLDAPPQDMPIQFEQPFEPTPLGGPAQLPFRPR